MDEQDVRDLSKARTLAGWSYVGIALPLIGWILGGISLSTLKYLEPVTTKAKGRVASVKKLAWGGIVASTLVVLVSSGVGFWIYRTAQQELKRQEAAQVEQEKQAGQQASYDSWQQDMAVQQAARQAEAQRVQLRACIDDVNSRVQEAAKQAYTSDQAAVLLQYKGQYTRDCELKYPTN